MYPIIFSLFFLFVGLGISVFGVKYLRKARSTLEWPQVNGIVFKSEVVSWADSDGDTMYGPRVEYEYSVKGAILHGQRVFVGMGGSSAPGYAEEIVARYPLESSVKVSYNPEDSSDAVLEPGISNMVYLPLGLGLFMSVFSVAMLYAACTAEFT